MAMWPWVERKFNLDFPETKFPDILERLRGTPARIDAIIEELDPSLLTQADGNGWTIQENIGHLLDLGYLPKQRIEQILAGEEVLIAADMTNKRTAGAKHNDRDIGDILKAFREERATLVARLEGLDPSDWGKSALHPRLQQPMRIVDIAFFDSEHDDYHLARIRELIRMFTNCPSQDGLRV